MPSASSNLKTRHICPRSYLYQTVSVGRVLTTPRSQTPVWERTWDSKLCSLHKETELESPASPCRAVLRLGQHHSQNGVWERGAKVNSCSGTWWRGDATNFM